MHARRVLAIVGLLGASALCVGLHELRVHETGDLYYRFLVWNLFLAWIPLLLAALAYARSRRRVDAPTAALLVAWLLFFPNAPYLLTDFIHLGRGPAPLWYDGLMLSAFAWTGLLLGFASLYLVQAILRRSFGVATSWLGVLGSLVLASLGVYIGRFVRLNSWDLLLHPLRVVEVVHARLVAEPPELAQALVALTAFLGVGYLVVYSFANLGLELDDDRRGREVD
ncbi:MAG TPA: DUF1361 domain-containing protein [Gaiellaceae bacterium]|nr:DUF1361 domain-containing protein [Gaiellaceae bacterium]